MLWLLKQVLKEDPWLAKALFEMYSKAKEIAYNNLETTTVVWTTLPWAKDEYESTRELMGDMGGIEANRKELEATMRYVFEQGLVRKQIRFEELFDSSIMS